MRLLLEGVLISVAVSIVVSFIAMRLASRSYSQRYTGAVGYAAGFLSAFAFAETRHLSPTLHWHWLPWLVVGAAIIGPVCVASGVNSFERLAMSVIFGLVTAWFLVPTRASLAPLRLHYMLSFAGTVTLVWNLLDRLANSKNCVTLMSAITATSLCSAGLVAYAVSIRMGFLGGAGAVALAGGGLAVVWKRDPTIVRGLIAAQSVVLCGVLLTAQLNDGLTIPAIAMILIAPLMLWLFEGGALSRLTGFRAVLAKTISVGMPLAVAFYLSWSGFDSEKF